jgi:phosphate-selective porin OprO/OprP
MKIGKLALMTGVAAIAIAAGAQAAPKKKTANPAPVAQPMPQPPVYNTVANADYSALAARVQTLEDQLAARDDRATNDRTRLSTLEQNYASAAWSFDNGRPTFASGDGRFTLAIRARFQADFAGYMQNQSDVRRAGFAGPTDLSSGAVMRRAYLGIEGKAYTDFSYEIRLNAGGSDGGSFGAAGVPNAGEGDPLLNKAVITYTGIPNWHFNVGVLEPAFMMEGTSSSASLMFMERPDFENIAADTFGAGDSRRGIEVGWAKTDTLWAGDNITATTTFSGGKTGSAQNHGTNSGLSIPGDGDENTQILGRITDRVWSDGISNIQIGVSLASVLDSGSNGNPNGGGQVIRLRDRPEIRVDGTRLIDTTNIAAKTADMFAFDMEGNIENFYLGGEYTQFSVDRQCGATTGGVCTSSTAVIDHPTFSAWAIEGSWILTGESKVYSPSAINNEVGGFNIPVPSRPFSFAGDSWGAWELVARYTDTDLNWHTNQAAVATGGVQAGILGGREKIVSLGVNWYLNRNIRVMFDDNIINLTKGTAALPDRDSQDLNVVSMRIQYAN